jgi:hypothetical protein
MAMKRLAPHVATLCSGFLALTFSALPAAIAQELVFGVLAGSSVTNTGTSVINGSVGVSPGTAITGFPPGLVTPPGAIYSNNAIAVQAQNDLTAAYNNLAGRPATANLTGVGLGGLVLTPGVYAFDTSAQLTGPLTLDGLGNPNAMFIFNVGSTLTTASGSSVGLINGAQGRNVFYRVGSSATLGTTTSFAGNILALTSITLNTGTTINCGAALARNGAVTLDTNTIAICTAAASPPPTPTPTPDPTDAHPPTPDPTPLRRHPHSDADAHANPYSDAQSDAHPRSDADAHPDSRNECGSKG